MRRLPADTVSVSKVPRVSSLSVPDTLRPSTTGTTPVASADSDVYKQAYRDGFDDGLADGQQAGRAEVEAIETQLREALAAAELNKERWSAALAALAEAFQTARVRERAAAEEVAVEVAFAALCRLLGEAHAEGQLVAGLCRTLLAESRLASPARLHLAPQDVPADSAHLPGLQVVPDPQLSPGMCLIRTDEGDLEGGIESRLSDMQETFLAVLRKERTR
jgi:flagellar assembly protein FliH